MAWVNVYRDTDLVAEYVQALRSVGFLEKIPAKIVRYLVSNVVGSIHPPTGLALSAADTFLLSKIDQGWGPTRFVDNYFAPFVKPK